MFKSSSEKHLFKAIILIVFYFFCFAFCDNQKVPQLMLLSFDGFRWDYINAFNTPTFDLIAERGVKASKGIRTAFVSKTFPAHWTIATGLYEESHGIIDNKFYDPVFNESFTKGLSDSKWWNGEPIWITAQKQHKKTGIYFWPGSETEFDGRRAKYWHRYNTHVKFEEQLNTSINWIKDGSVDFAMVYFNQPDKSGHKYGAFSDEVKDAVEKSDDLLKLLLNQLSESNRLENVNLIVLSDHGMANLTSADKRLIVLADFIDFKNDVIDVPQTGSLAGIRPKSGKLMQVYNKLKDAHPNMTVYLKENIPERFHYKNNRRITPIVAIADEGFLIAKFNYSLNSSGAHGYDNHLTSMNPIFFAMGPDFKKNFSSEIFESVNIYSLMCHLLRINPSPNNGSIENVKHLLSDESRKRINKITSKPNSSSKLGSNFQKLADTLILVTILFNFFKNI